jgi:hypothetical protein
VRNKRNNETSVVVGEFSRVINYWMLFMLFFFIMRKYVVCWWWVIRMFLLAFTIAGIVGCVRIVMDETECRMQFRTYDCVWAKSCEDFPTQCRVQLQMPDKSDVECRHAFRECPSFVMKNNNTMFSTNRKCSVRGEARCTAIYWDSITEAAPQAPLATVKDVCHEYSALVFLIAMFTTLAGSMLVLSFAPEPVRIGTAAEEEEEEEGEEEEEEENEHQLQNGDYIAVRTYE